MMERTRIPALSSQAMIVLLTVPAAFALLSTLQSAAALDYGGDPVPWVGLLKARLVNWYGCALFVPLLCWLAAKHPIDRAGWRTAVPIHLIASLVCALAKEALFVAVGDWFRPGVFHLPEILAGDYFDEVLLFWAVIAVIHAVLGQQSRARAATLGEPLNQPPAGPPTRFTIRDVHGVRLVRIEDVEWIQAEGNYARLHTGAGSHLVRETMAALERQLSPRFVRVHRSAIVNRDSVTRVAPRSHGSYAIGLASGASVVSGRAYNNRLRALFD